MFNNNMASSFKIFIVFLAFTASLIAVSSSESAEILTIHNPNPSHEASIAVSVTNQELEQVANNVLSAETWLKTHVLSNYPNSNITHIVVAHNLLCSHKSHHKFHHKHILPALQNLHHSLTRWALHSKIKVSPSFSTHCLNSHHLSQSSLIKPILQFIGDTNSTYLINPIHENNPKFHSLAQTHLEFAKKIGFFTFFDMKLVQNGVHYETIKPFTMRKLSQVEGSLPPLVGIGPTPITGPLSPTHSPPQMAQTPSYTLHPHHNHHHNLPPCNPWGGPVSPILSPPPPPHYESPGPVSPPEKLWCVAKPSVPAETLQEAIDYACGVGGAECEEIQPNGSCYNPDTVVAHASYAFNSYWQMNKKNAGTCSFGGTAIIINSDPSFQQCRFIVT